MDFKWTLSRPGISLEFETGSVKEAIGLLEQEGTAIQDVFGLTMGHAHAAAQEVAGEVATGAEPPKTRKPRGSNKTAPEAVAPEPLPVPSQEAPLAPPLPTPAATPLPANELALNANGVPAFLDASNRAPPLPVAPTPPPVGVLGPKMVAVLDEKAKGAVDGGQALADWLAQCGLTIKGKTFAEACRAVLMISDEKLKPAADILGVA